MEEKLDVKDKRLLYELDLNSRQSVNSLARKLKLGKTATNYRLNQLQERGIIKQFHTILDVGKLGYISFRLYLKLQNASPQKEQDIIDFLKNKKEVTWLVSIEGDYNIGALILVKNVKEMNNLWKELLSKYSNYIDQKLLTIMTRVSYFSRSYLLDSNKNDYELVFVTEPEKEIYLDEKDSKILNLIAPNSRISIIDMATKLKLTSKTIIERLRSLEKRKIIVGYKSVFDLEKLGYEYYKIHFKLNNITKEKEFQFRNFVKQHPNIIYDDEVLGGDDFEIEVQVKNTKELRDVIEKIKSLFSSILKDYKIMQFYKEHKYVLLPN